MKQHTQVCLTIRHVGDAKHPVEFHNCTVKEAYVLVAKFMVNHSLASRMEFTVCRNEEEARNLMNPNRTVRITKRNESVFEDIDQAWEEIGGD
jgi:hypothetical protein